MGVCIGIDMALVVATEVMECVGTMYFIIVERKSDVSTGWNSITGLSAEGEASFA